MGAYSETRGIHGLTSKDMVNRWLTLALSVYGKTANGHKAKGARQRAGTRQATLARFRKLAVKARQDGSIQNMTDAGLFSAFRDVVARGGGDDAFAMALHADGDENLARDVLALSACQTASEFMAVGL